ncbi:hypothetical protein [Bradyrhizobium sp. JYMT SZCCT0428]|uniref:hypothetical protein n=1 Tax=Bradyrhizobium sp. JYMT SZCCT0428 TaxID=2807673 RepID=UPI001BAC5DD9|nr:hypothetical protein [Bradyrhizobium sp. JYMT SZCCT0428]MBR1152807.1 hypothetical protein [Bradyrhizobium sp. JYMT SZCCT0428]
MNTAAVAISVGPYALPAGTSFWSGALAGIYTVGGDLSLAGHWLFRSFRMIARPIAANPDLNFLLAGPFPTFHFAFAFSPTWKRLGGLRPADVRQGWRTFNGQFPTRQALQSDLS